ncbi:hypothetical protein [Kitasatospora sp. NPDC127116]|uniref:hypothetical protein n=1 Tax=Kitasatospora sp. NPDC127116 TaxID=3345367 RepID=UPI003380D302
MDEDEVVGGPRVAGVPRLAGGEDDGAVRALNVGEAADAAAAVRVVEPGAGLIGAGGEVVGAVEAVGTGGLEGGDDQVAGENLVGAYDPQMGAGEDAAARVVLGGGCDDDRVEVDVMGMRAVSFGDGWISRRAVGPQSRRLASASSTTRPSVARRPSAKATDPAGTDKASGALVGKEPGKWTTSPKSPDR